MVVDYISICTVHCACAHNKFRTAHTTQYIISSVIIVKWADHNHLFSLLFEIATGGSMHGNKINEETINLLP